jgi:hypothetical protein
MYYCKRRSPDETEIISQNGCKDSRFNYAIKKMVVYEKEMQDLK